MGSQKENFTITEKIAINGMFRGRITEENSLINQRMSWMIFSESLLVAAWAAIATKLPEVTSRLPSPVTREEVRLILIGIPIVGLIVAAASLIGVIAAYMEIGTMCKMYETKFQSIETDHTLPKLTGSGPAHFLGHLMPWILPGAFAFLQICMLLHSCHI